MKKRKYFNKNYDYFKFIKNNKNIVEIIKVYYTKTLPSNPIKLKSKICVIYNNL